MVKHLAPAVVIDLAEGRAVAPEALAHKDACPSCREQVEQVRTDLAWLPEAELPEPSPLYWAAFRRQVADRLRDERLQHRRERWMWVPAVAAAGLAVALFLPRADRRAPLGPTPTAATAALPAWDALPATVQDDGWAVLQAAVSEGTMVADSECVDVEDCLADLGDDDVHALTETLRAARAGGEL